MAANTAKNSIESMLSRLEDITRTMENPDTGIESSITLYEEGLSIAARCRKRLQEARQKIEIINPQTTPPAVPAVEEDRPDLFSAAP